MQRIGRAVWAGAALIALTSNSPTAHGGRSPGATLHGVWGRTPLSVVATFAIGTDHGGLAVDPATHTLYVTNRYSNTVSIVSGMTGRTRATISVGQDPRSLVFDPVTHLVYVANWASNTLSVIDARTQRVRATVRTGTHPAALALDAALHTLYSADSGTTGKRTGTDTGTLRVLNTATLQALATPVQAVDVTLAAVAVDTSTHAVYLAMSAPGGASVMLLNGVTKQVSAVVGVSSQPGSLAVEARLHRVYLTDANGPLLTILEGARTASAPRFASPTPLLVHVGETPSGVAVDASVQAVFVANTGSNTVSVVDAVTNRVMAAVPIGSRPWSLAVDPATHRVYVTHQNSNIITVLAPPRPA